MTYFILYYLLIILLGLFAILYLHKAKTNYSGLIPPFIITAISTSLSAYYLFSLFLKNAALTYGEAKAGFELFPFSEIAFAIITVIVLISVRQYVRSNKPESILLVPRKSFFALAMFFVLPAIIHSDKMITFTLTLFTALVLFITSLFFSKQQIKKSYWLTLIYAYPIVVILDVLKFTLLSISVNTSATITNLFFPFEFLLYDFSIVLLANSLLFFLFARTGSLKSK